MSNLSDLTRKEQVLVYLRARTGLWVDGSELATAEVGGSEGLRRLRELESEYNIQRRKHPDPDRDVWQYRLLPGKAPKPILGPEFDEAVEAGKRQVTEMFGDQPPPDIRPQHRPPVDHVRKRELERKAAQSPWPADHEVPRISDAVRRREDGTFEYVPPQEPLIGDQLTIPAAEPEQPPEARFSQLPKKIDWGAVAVCPRCRAKTNKGRAKKKVEEDDSRPTMVQERRRKKSDDGSMPLVDEDGVLLHKDPHSRKPKPCERCNGYGIVPNQGPIAFTKPTGVEPTEPGVEAPSIEAFEP